MAAVTRIESGTKPKVLWRGFLLYILPLPLLPAAFFALMDGEPIKALARAAGFVLAMTAATLIRKGIRLDNEALKRRLRRRASTVRYRMIGAALVSAGMFIVAWLGIANQYSLIESALYGLAVLLGCYLYYDFDPARKDPDIAAVGITTEELIELLDEAEGRIQGIEQASRDIHNPEFKDRNLWSLYNAFTETLKGGLLKLPQRSEALHGVLDIAVQVEAKEALALPG